MTRRSRRASLTVVADPGVRPGDLIVGVNGCIDARIDAAQAIPVLDLTEPDEAHSVTSLDSVLDAARPRWPAERVLGSTSGRRAPRDRQRCSG